MFYGSRIQRSLGALLMLVTACASLAHASATLLLEEPFGRLGFFAATGHAAVYLSDICAETPLKLRPCKPGEWGAVISRYNGVNGYDWLAIPLIPYLYAVDDPGDIPLYGDPKLVNFLRDQYRRKHLEDVAPDAAHGATPGGNWYELVGTSYDRTVYAFEVKTTRRQDATLIEKYNSLPNHSHFRTVSRNCADFAKDLMNFYYPKALHRSFVADVGIATPKQMAKTLIKYGSRHPEAQLSRYVIPQVPGIEARSEPVHGVVESFFRSKKYIVPSAVVSPIFAGCVAAVYVGTGAGRFDPAQHALVFSADRDLQKPIGSEDRRAYELELNHLQGGNEGGLLSLMRSDRVRRLLRNAKPDFDASGRPVLRIRKGEEILNVGISESNISSNPAEGPFMEELLEARLRAELRKGVPKASESDVNHDWVLLQNLLNRTEDQVAAQNHRPLPASQTRVEQSGNQP